MKKYTTLFILSLFIIILFVLFFLPRWEEDKETNKNLQRQKSSTEHVINLGPYIGLEPIIFHTNSAPDMNRAICYKDKQIIGVARWYEELELQPGKMVRIYKERNEKLFIDASRDVVVYNSRGKPFLLNTEKNLNNNGFCEEVNIKILYSNTTLRLAVLKEWR